MTVTIHYFAVIRLQFTLYSGQAAASFSKGISLMDLIYRESPTEIHFLYGNIFVPCENVNDLGTICQIVMPCYGHYLWFDFLIESFDNCH